MGKNNPKPARKAAAVTTRSARTPGGAKVTYQTSKTIKEPVTGDNGKTVLNKKGEYDSNSNSSMYGLKNAKTNAQMKKAVKNGQFPSGVTGAGKGKNPATKFGKEGPSFKKKKP